MHPLTQMYLLRALSRTKHFLAHSATENNRGINTDSFLKKKKQTNKKIQNV